MGRTLGRYVREAVAPGPTLPDINMRDGNGPPIGRRSVVLAGRWTGKRAGRWALQPPPGAKKLLGDWPKVFLNIAENADWLA